jgi:SAM-dependent methyltransferase
MRNSVDLSNGYERIAAEFLAGRGRAENGVGASTVRAWARSLPPGSTVLDVGCGSGVPISKVLLDEGLSVCGVDASPSFVAAFRQRFPDAPIACEMAEHSTFFNRSFEAIIAWGLVFLLPAAAQAALIHRMARALADGGRLLFTAPEQVCEWEDAMTGNPSQSLGAAAYKHILLAAGLSLVGEYNDEGENHYYDAVRREIASRTTGD